MLLHFSLLVGAGALLAFCAADVPTASSARGADESNIPGGASGWAQVQAELSARRATAQAEIGETRRALESTGDDCAATCPLVASLHTAVDRLCQIRENRDDDGRCKDGRDGLAGAVAHVKSTCGGCRPGAHTDDADAASESP